MKVLGRPEIVLNAFLSMLTQDGWGCIYSQLAEVGQIRGHQASAKVIWRVPLNAMEVILEVSYIPKPREDSAFFYSCAG